MEDTAVVDAPNMTLSDIKTFVFMAQSHEVEVRHKNKIED